MVTRNIEKQHLKPNYCYFCLSYGLTFSHRKFEEILFLTENRLVGSYTDSLLTALGIPLPWWLLIADFIWFQEESVVSHLHWGYWFFVLPHPWLLQRHLLWLFFWYSVSNFVFHLACWFLAANLFHTLLIVSPGVCRVILRPILKKFCKCLLNEWKAIIKLTIWFLTGKVNLQVQVME